MLGVLPKHIHCAWSPQALRFYVVSNLALGDWVVSVLVLQILFVASQLQWGGRCACGYGLCWPTGCCQRAWERFGAWGIHISL